MLKSDLHIHTLMSGHAFSTINECIEVACNRGLELIAITDHGPAMEGSAHEGYFEMSGRIPRIIDGLGVLFGCEMNILNKYGEVDLSDKTMSGLDIVLAGLHERTPYTNEGEANNTSAIVNAMIKHPKISIITHPVRSEFPISVKDVAQAAKECNVIIEINVSLLLRAIECKSDSRSFITIDKTAQLVSCLHSVGGNYIINSDAHHSNEIGVFNHQYEMLIAELGLLPEFVLNNNFEMLQRIIPSIDIKGGKL